MQRSQCVAWILFIIAEVIGIYFIIALVNFGDDAQKAKSMDTQDRMFQKETKNVSHLYQKHAIFMATMGVLLTGTGLAVFRLLRGLKTRIIKYIHGLINTASLVLMVLGTIYVYQAKNEEATALFRITHAYLGAISMSCFIILYIWSIFVYIYLYEDKRLRSTVASAHNFVGYSIFLFFVLATLTGFVFRNYSSSNPKENPDFSNNDLIWSLYGYCLLISILVLSPYFEWELIGPI